MQDQDQQAYELFKKRIETDLMTHRVIVNNEYCHWFKIAPLSREDLRCFTVQFSVFSNLFLIAQLKKMINAVDLEEMHQAKEILANELGCIFRRTKGSVKDNDGCDPNMVSTQGTVDGGTFSFKAAHFEWLLNFGKALDLGFKDMGKRSHGSKSTLFFCDELERLYGNENYCISAGAGYAVENWAAAGFWKQLSAGLNRYKKDASIDLPLGFFVWHDKVEDQHKESTHEELEQLYFGEHPFDEDLFIQSGLEMLNGVAAFWDGLNDERLSRVPESPDE